MCFYDIYTYVYIIEVSIPCTLHIFFTEIQNFVTVSVRIQVFNNSSKFGNVATYRFKLIWPNKWV